MSSIVTFKSIINTYYIVIPKNEESLFCGDFTTMKSVLDNFSFGPRILTDLTD
jgi:hypothetical protein